MTSLRALSVAEAGIPTTQDQKTFSYLLSTLLEQASYSPELQQQYLSFYNTHILPYLNVFPTWKSNLTHNGSPFEPSRNIVKGRSVIRFCFEPVSSLAGTPSDPFNQAASLALVAELGKLDMFEGFDAELWEYFTEEFFIWDADDVEEILATREMRRLRSSLLAFDLKKTGSGIMLKGYVNFFRKASLLKKSPAVLIFDAVRRLDGREDEKAAINMLEQLAIGRDAGYEGITNMAKGNIFEIEGEQNIAKENIAAVDGLNFVMMAFDFIGSLKARIKIYARSYDLTFSNFKEIYTLGGQINVSEEELNVFKNFYAALFDLPDSWDGVTEHVQRMNKRHAGVLWQFELMQGRRIPEVKLYLSFWNFVPNDAEGARRLKRLFKSWAWALEESYSAEIEQLFGPENVERESGRHSYVSYSYSKEAGAYLTLYYAPKLEREQ